MTAQQGRRPAKMSRLSLALAVGSSGAVAAAAVAGHDFSTPEVVGALAMAGTIAAVSFRHEPEAEPHVFRSVTQGTGDVPVIGAPKARNIVAHPAAHSDAA
jgi:hypothetical protein